MTFSHILRKNINIRYLNLLAKTLNFKNNKYKYVKHFIVKGIIRGLK